MVILGISFETHESSVALLDDGRILFAAAEERYSRIKMDGSGPIRALQAGLRHTGLCPSDIDIVAISGFAPPKNWYMYARHVIVQKAFTSGRDLRSVQFRLGNRDVVLRGPAGVLANLALCTGAPQVLLLYLLRRIRIARSLRGFKGSVTHISHHDCHVASACFTAGFDECLSVVVEGSDWHHSFVMDEYAEGSFRAVAKTRWPHSPGSFYELATTLLGFNYLRHAGKVTGLAAHGNPHVAYEKVAPLMRAEGLEIRVSPLIYTLREEYLLSGKIPAYFAEYAHADIAAAFQRRLEDVVVETVSAALQKIKHTCVVLAGGVTSNVVLNERVNGINGVEKIFVHPAMTDAGQALGAALYAHNRELRKSGQHARPMRLRDVYLGSEYDDHEIRAALEEAGVKYVKVDDMEVEVARLLADKQVVARFNGRMEYGPRALGNRSILAHAGDPEVNDWLNKRLQRTEFMPFAPSVLADESERYFPQVKGAEHAAEFMTLTFRCSDEMKARCPGVVHVDGTARPHFVVDEKNPSYGKILREYFKRTGVAVILNTSFNMHEEPIVSSPADAVRAFQAAGIDYLAIGNYLVARDGLR